MAASGARILTPIVLRLELIDVPSGAYELKVRLTDRATGVRTLDSSATLVVAESSEEGR
jgi:hypothetical protein